MNSANSNSQWEYDKNCQHKIGEFAQQEKNKTKYQKLTEFIYGTFYYIMRSGILIPFYYAHNGIMTCRFKREKIITQEMLNVVWKSNIGYKSAFYTKKRVFM